MLKGTWFRLIPWRADGDPDEVFGAQLACGISLLFAGVGIFYTVETALNARQGAPMMTALCAIGAVLFTTNAAMLRWRSLARLVRWTLSLELVVLLGAAAALSRGYRTYDTAWEMVVPLLVMFLLGTRNGLICAVLVGVQAVAFWWLETAGVFVPPFATLEPTPHTAMQNVVVVLVVVAAIGLIYERSHAARRRALANTIGELERAHAQLSNAQRQLIADKKLSSLGMLAAGIAHEINNPMAYVTANVGALQRDLPKLAADPELFREYAEEVLPPTIDGIRRVNAIVGDLRRFARGDPESFTAYDLNDEIRAALRMSQSQLKQRGSRLDLSLGEVPKIHGRPHQIMQVVMNLVVNAAQANGAGGSVRIASWEAGEEVAIKVQDTGPGMSRETLDRLFQPFFTTKPVGEGTGLGLAVAHGIVSSHGGRIEVESNPGAGSAFIVWLPKMPPAGAGAPR